MLLLFLLSVDDTDALASGVELRLIAAMEWVSRDSLHGF